MTWCHVALLLLSAMSAALGTQKLSNVRFKVLAGEVPIVFRTTYSSDGTPTHTGAAYELFKWLALRLNFSYDLELPQLSTVFGAQYENGSYDGLLGYLQRRECDFALSAFGYLYPAELGDYSTYWAVLDFALLIPYPEERSKTWAAFWPFQPMIWFLLVASFALTTLSIKLAEGLKKSINKAKSTDSDSLMYLVGVITAQGGVLTRQGRVVIVISIFWCIFCFFVVNSYSSLLISFLTSSKPVPLVDSLGELAEKAAAKKITFVTLRGTEPDMMMMDSTFGMWKTLGDSLRPRPYDRKDLNVLCVQETLENSKPCILPTAALDRFIALDLKSSQNKCRLSRSKEVFLPVLVTFMYRKHWEYTDLFNKEILLANAMGLTSYWFDKDRYKPYQCLDRRSAANSGMKPLLLSDMSSAFVILAFGIACSFLTFAAELLSKRFKWTRQGLSKMTSS